VAAPSKKWVCGCSLAEIVGSNPSGGWDICIFRVLCVVRHRTMRRYDHSSRGLLPSVTCLSECDRGTWTMGRPGSIRSVERLGGGGGMLATRQVKIPLFATGLNKLRS